jgi:hypothetical protein
LLDCLIRKLADVRNAKIRLIKKDTIDIMQKEGLDHTALKLTTQN